MGDELLPPREEAATLGHPSKPRWLVYMLSGAPELPSRAHFVPSSLPAVAGLAKPWTAAALAGLSALA